MNVKVVEAAEGIVPLPEVEGVETTVVLIGKGGRGGRMPPALVVVTGVRGLPDEVAVFTSIFTTIFIIFQKG
jgi:hypothetical protein